MAEVFARFDQPIAAPDGTRYYGQVCGAPADDGMWHGWIEFTPVNGGAPLRSPRETTQPKRSDIQYWATGLTDVFAEGSLRRALSPLVRRKAVPRTANFDGPAPDLPIDDAPVASDTVLNPFSVYEKGEAVLRKELGALSAWHLVNIIVAHRLSSESVTVLNRLPGLDLIEIIVAGVRERFATRR